MLYPQLAANYLTTQKYNIHESYFQTLTFNLSKLLVRLQLYFSLRLT